MHRPVNQYIAIVVIALFASGAAYLIARISQTTSFDGSSANTNLNAAISNLNLQSPPK